MDKTKHIGDVGDRVVVAGRVLSVERVDTDFGNSALIKLVGDGLLCAWMSSHGEYAYTLTPGQPLTVRATVKKYLEHEGALWVQITNGRVVFAFELV